MMAAAMELNIASGSSGIMPRIVVSEAIITGRRRFFELRMRASTGSIPLDISIDISSMSTMPIFTIMPISPSVPTIATKSNVLPVISMARITPMTTMGMLSRMMAGLR